MPETVQMKPVIILGAGITGLITAWKLAQTGREITIIEKSDSVGGLARTYEWDGYYFDNGAHNFFTRDKEILDFYLTTFPGLLIPRKRNFKLFIFGKLLSFPFLGIELLLSFGMINFIKMGYSFLGTRLKLLFRTPPETNHLDEWIIQRYGKVLYNLYFRNYLMLVQKIDPHLLSSAIGIKKIPLMSVRKMVKEIIGRFIGKDPELKLVSGISYYTNKGIGSIPNKFYELLKEYPNVVFKFNESLINIEENENCISGIQTEKQFYDTSGADIISTIPLSRLCVFKGASNPEISHTASKITYSRMRFVFVKVSKPLISGCWFINFNDEKFPFYRVSEEVFGEFGMVPEKSGCSLLFEISVDSNDIYSTMPEEELLVLLIERLNTVFPITLADVVKSRSVYCDEANPRLTIRYKENLREIFAYIFSKENLFSIGRQGFFTYGNIDHCTRMALDFCGYYINGIPKEGNRILFEKSLDT